MCVRVCVCVCEGRIRRKREKEGRRVWMPCQAIHMRDIERVEAEYRATLAIKQSASACVRVCVCVCACVRVCCFCCYRGRVEEMKGGTKVSWSSAVSAQPPHTQQTDTLSQLKRVAYTQSSGGEERKREREREREKKNHVSPLSFFRFPSLCVRRLG